MKEIDFDELDRAVNSLMADMKPEDSDSQQSDSTPVAPVVPSTGGANVGGPSEEVAVAESSTPSIATPQPARDSDQTANVGDSPQGASPAKRIAPATPLVARRSGRFMDVVPPASTRVKAKSAPSREGVLLNPAPTASVASVEPASELQTTDVLPNTSADTVESNPTDVGPAAISETPVTDAMPDPLDVMQGFLDDGVSASTAEEPARPEAGNEADGVAQANDVGADDSGPLMSPFLSDAKIEKRPLGSPQHTETPRPEVKVSTLAELNEELTQDISAIDPESRVESTVTTDTSVIKVGKEKMEDGGVVNPQSLPEELQDTILAVESGEAVEPDDDPAASIEVPNLQPAGTQSMQDVSSIGRGASTPADMNGLNSAPTVGMGGSIPQQYKEVPETSTGEHVPMYDSGSATPQLNHPAKSKSGWMVVVAIVVLILVSIGGAVGLYYLGVI